uniref:F-box domain-containing protein n=1 Tax=Rhizochromulina marina TaxID=1034831 RepID=A0A7S2SSC1_9STRA|mmetsp:Transcript_4133/g.12174  ORF Transcript_4133/g.12174 Transcript_4133/m.12174 type:complete len:281 (+) Transcript_4133:89-931(+)
MALTRGAPAAASLPQPMAMASSNGKSKRRCCRTSGPRASLRHGGAPRADLQRPPLGCLPTHLFSHAAEWCDLASLLKLGQCSQMWSSVTEAYLLPSAVHRDCGVAVYELKPLTAPDQTWANYVQSLLTLALPAANAIGSRRRERVTCRQVLHAATRALAKDGQNLCQVLQHDMCGNLTVVSPFRVPVQSIRHHALYWEVYVGSNTNGNVFIGIMSDYGGIRQPAPQEHMVSTVEPLPGGGGGSAAAAASATDQNNTRSAALPPSSPNQSSTTTQCPTAHV